MLKPLLISALLFAAAPVFAAPDCAPVSVGDLAVQNAWSRATIGAGRPAVFYVEIVNSGAADDALLSISTPAAAMPMIHETVVKDGIASMPHTMRVPVPANGSVRLEPSGYHGMLMDLTAPLKEGDSYEMTLTFEHAGAVTITVPVLSIRAGASECAAGN